MPEEVGVCPPHTVFEDVFVRPFAFVHFKAESHYTAKSWLQLWISSQLLKVWGYTRVPPQTVDLSMSLWVRVYVHVCMRMCECASTCAWMCMCVCMWVSILVTVYVCVCVKCTWVCMCMCVHVYVCCFPGDQMQDLVSSQQIIYHSAAFQVAPARHTHSFLVLTK